MSSTSFYWIIVLVLSTVNRCWLKVLHTSLLWKERPYTINSFCSVQSTEWWPWSHSCTAMYCCSQSCRFRLKRHATWSLPMHLQPVTLCHCRFNHTYTSLSHADSFDMGHTLFLQRTIVSIRLHILYAQTSGKTVAQFIFLFVITFVCIKPCQAMQHPTTYKPYSGNKWPDYCQKVPSLIMRMFRTPSLIVKRFRIPSFVINSFVYRR